jgi:hypothetical protein
MITGSIGAAFGSQIRLYIGSLDGTPISDARFIGAGLGALLFAHSFAFDPRASRAHPGAGCLFVGVAVACLGALCWLLMQPAGAIGLMIVPPVLTTPAILRVALLMRKRRE